MASVGRRNGIYGGWTHAGNNRVFVRVPTQLKRDSEQPLNGLNGSNGNGNGNGSHSDREATPIVLVHSFSSGRSEGQGDSPYKLMVLSLAPMWKLSGRPLSLQSSQSGVQ